MQLIFTGREKGEKETVANPITASKKRKKRRKKRKKNHNRQNGYLEFAPESYFIATCYTRITY